jgi:hypothetical protein
MFLLFGISSIASAQSTSIPKSTKIKTPSGAGKAHQTAGNTKNGKADTVQLSNRENYKWSDGQQATPSNGSGYAALKKIRPSWQKKGKRSKDKPFTLS